MGKAAVILVLVLVGYPLSVVATAMLGVPLRYVWRQAFLCYAGLWLPLVALYWWMSR